jgi:hypothetical protein
MLPAAIEKARRLVAELERQQAELEATPGDLSPEKSAEGKRAFADALASARRALTALEDAARIAPENSPEDSS